MSRVSPNISATIAGRPDNQLLATARYFGFFWVFFWMTKDGEIGRLRFTVNMTCTVRCESITNVSEYRPFDHSIGSCHPGKPPGINLRRWTTRVSIFLSQHQNRKSVTLLDVVLRAYVYDSTFTVSERHTFTHFPPGSSICRVRSTVYNPL